MQCSNDILDQIYSPEEAQRIRNLEPLHTLTIPTDGDDTSNGALQNNNALDNAAGVSVYFRDLEQHLIAHIQAADAIIGCVAWLTHQDILAALAAVPSGVGLIVQKEDFLRPDLGAKSSWKKKLRALYDSLPAKLTRHQFPLPLGRCSVSCDPAIASVRCVGNYNADKYPAFPRMHHKFLVFCRSEPDLSQGVEYVEYIPRKITPYACWTGSFNFTKNAVASFENALYITNEIIVRAYFHEWAQIAALSEPLDWESRWVAPEWRIGT